MMGSHANNSLKEKSRGEHMPYGRAKHQKTLQASRRHGGSYQSSNSAQHGGGGQHSTGGSQRRQDSSASSSSPIAASLMSGDGSFGRESDAMAAVSGRGGAVNSGNYATSAGGNPNFADFSFNKTVPQNNMNHNNINNHNNNNNGGVGNSNVAHHQTGTNSAMVHLSAAPPVAAGPNNIKFSPLKAPSYQRSSANFLPENQHQRINNQSPSGRKQAYKSPKHITSSSNGTPMDQYSNLTHLNSRHNQNVQRIRTSSGGKNLPLQDDFTDVKQFSPTTNILSPLYCEFTQKQNPNDNLNNKTAYHKAAGMCTHNSRTDGMDTRKSKTKPRRKNIVSDREDLEVSEKVKAVISEQSRLRGDSVGEYALLGFPFEGVMDNRKEGTSYETKNDQKIERNGGMKPIDMKVSASPMQKKQRCKANRVEDKADPEILKFSFTIYHIAKMDRLPPAEYNSEMKSSDNNGAKTHLDEGGYNITDSKAMYLPGQLESSARELPFASAMAISAKIDGMNGLTELKYTGQMAAAESRKSDNELEESFKVELSDVAEVDLGDKYNEREVDGVKKDVMRDVLQEDERKVVTAVVDVSVELKEQSEEVVISSSREVNERESPAALLLDGGSCTDEMSTVSLPNETTAAKIAADENVTAVAAATSSGDNDNSGIVKIIMMGADSGANETAVAMNVEQLIAHSTELVTEISSDVDVLPAKHSFPFVSPMASGPKIPSSTVKIMNDYHCLQDKTPQAISHLIDEPPHTSTDGEHLFDGKKVVPAAVIAPERDDFCGVDAAALRKLHTKTAAKDEFVIDEYSGLTNNAMQLTEPKTVQTASVLESVTIPTSPPLEQNIKMGSPSAAKPFAKEPAIVISKTQQQSPLKIPYTSPNLLQSSVIPKEKIIMVYVKMKIEGKLRRKNIPIDMRGPLQEPSSRALRQISMISNNPEMKSSGSSQKLERLKAAPSTSNESSWRYASMSKAIHAGSHSNKPQDAPRIQPIPSASFFSSSQSFTAPTASMIDFQRTQPKRAELSLEEKFRRDVNSLLNKITVEKFEKITTKLADLLESNNNSRGVEIVVNSVYNKAVTEPDYGEMYADLCIVLRWRSKVKCAESGIKEDFQYMLNAHMEAEFRNIKAKGTALTEEEMKLLSLEDQEFEVQKRKKRILGNVHFLGNLVTRRLIGEVTVNEGVSLLFETDKKSGEVPDEAFVECAVELLTAVGHYLDNNNQEILNDWISKLKNLQNSGRYQNRIYYKIQDLLDLRGKNWMKKVFKEKAMTHQQVLADAKEEDRKGGAVLQAQSGKYTIIGSTNLRPYDGFLAREHEVYLNRKGNSALISAKSNAASGSCNASKSETSQPEIASGPSQSHPTMPPTLLFETSKDCFTKKWQSLSCEFNNDEISIKRVRDLCREADSEQMFDFILKVFSDQMKKFDVSIVPFVRCFAEQFAMEHHDEDLIDLANKIFSSLNCSELTEVFDSFVDICVALIKPILQQKRPIQTSFIAEGKFLGRVLERLGVSRGELSSQ